MLEERAYELRGSSNFCKLLVNSRPQLFALLQRASRNSGAFDVAPNQFVWIEVWGIT
jgi:hypothetical protein